MAQTPAAFISKLSIVVEEADESEFRFDFGMEFNLFDTEKVNVLMCEAHELASIYITTRSSLRNGK